MKPYIVTPGDYVLFAGMSPGHRGECNWNDETTLGPDDHEEGLLSISSTFMATRQKGLMIVPNQLQMISFFPINK